jgi:hypothetical protein
MYIGRGIVIENVLAGEVDRAGIAMLADSLELNPSEGTSASDSVSACQVVNNPYSPLDTDWHEAPVGDWNSGSTDGTVVYAGYLDNIRVVGYIVVSGIEIGDRGNIYCSVKGGALAHVDRRIDPHNDRLDRSRYHQFNEVNCKIFVSGIMGKHDVHVIVIIDVVAISKPPVGGIETVDVVTGAQRDIRAGLHPCACIDVPSPEL